MIRIERWDEEQDGPLSEAAMTRKLASRGYEVHRFTYSPGTDFPDHVHDVDKIDAVLTGRFRVTIGDREVILEAGDCVAIPRGAIHRAEVVGEEPVVSLDGIRSPADGDEKSAPPEPEAANEPTSRLLAEAVRALALDVDDSTRRRISRKKLAEPENVHEIRVCTKRLRAWWQLVRPVIEPQIARIANERLRDLARALAGARDAQVLADLLVNLRDADEPLYRATFDRAAILLADESDLADRADELRPAMLAAIDADRNDWRSLVLPDDDSLIELGLGRAYRKTRRRAETAGRTRSHTDLHRWRRWVKYLRYQLESLTDTPPTSIATLIETLASLGRILGQLNDLAVLRERLVERGEGDPFGAVFRAIDLRNQALMRRIGGVSARLFDATPEDFVTVVRREIADHEAVLE